MTRHLVRSMVVPAAVLAVVALVGAAFGVRAAPVVSADIQTDGGALPAGIHVGGCLDFGEVTHELGEVALPTDAPGAPAIPVAVSFTTLDVALADLGGAIVVGGGTADEPYVACGSFGPQQPDDEHVYVGLSDRVGFTDQTGSGYVGFAWLNARGDRTRVAVFLTQGLAEDGGAAPPDTPTAEPADATAAATGGTGGTDDRSFASAAFGWRLTWDRSWRAVNANDASGILWLTNDTSDVVLGSSDRYRGNRQTCLRKGVAFFEDFEGLALEPLLVDGEPIEGSADTRVFAAYTYAVAADEVDDGVVARRAAGERALYVECRTVAPGETTLSIDHYVAADAYGDEVAAREALLAGLELPAAPGG